MKRLTCLLSSILLITCVSCGTPNDTESSSPDEDFVVSDNIDSSIHYQIFVRSFADSDGDGIGDLKGIENKVEYLKTLGVKNVWLTPIHKTSSDHGYDVEDYYSVASDLGGMEAFESLVATLKEANIGIIVDMVFNHGSTKTSYFTTAYNAYKSNKEDPKAKWFNFSDENKGKHQKYKDVYFESSFETNTMADFNLDSEEVKEEFANILTFWKEKGVAGFRFDAVKYFFNENVSTKTVEFCNYLKSICPDLYYIGEGWDNDNLTLSKYFQSNFDSFFNFPSYSGASLSSGIMAATNNMAVTNLYNIVSSTLDMVYTSNETYNKSSVVSFFQSNHDMDRIASITKDDTKLKMIAATTYLLPGTPYIYYGEEIGLRGKRFSGEYTDANRRMPMLFEEEVRCNPLKGTTFTDQIDTSVNEEKEKSNSILNNYIYVTSIRNKIGKMMLNAKYKRYDSAYNKITGLYAYTLYNDTQSYSFIMNLNKEEISFELSKEYESIIGYRNCEDVSVKYDLAGQNITLPAKSFIVFKDK